MSKQGTWAFPVLGKEILYFSSFSDVKIKLLGQSTVQCGAFGYSVNASHHSSTALEWQNEG